MPDENKTTRFGLLRHGATVAGARFCGSADVALTPDGLRQMWTAIDNTKHNWNVIITSPSRRCADFAHALSQQGQLTFRIDKRLREIHFGAWEGKTAHELMQNHSDALSLFWSDPARYTPPDAESLADFKTRVLSAWHDLLNQYGGEKILIVTHGGVIRVLLCHAHQHPVNRLLEFDVPPASLNHIDVGSP